MELVRRTRLIHLVDWKASEYRNLIVAYIPLVYDALAASISERKLWMLTSHLVRAMLLPDHLYDRIKPDDIRKRLVKWYRAFEKLYGRVNLRYNVHVFHHLDQVRK